MDIVVKVVIEDFSLIFSSMVAQVVHVDFLNIARIGETG